MAVTKTHPIKSTLKAAIDKDLPRVTWYILHGCKQFTWVMNTLSDWPEIMSSACRRL